MIKNTEKKINNKLQAKNHSVQLPRLQYKLNIFIQYSI